MKSRLILFFFALFIWFLFSHSFDIQNVVMGVMAALLVAVLTGGIFTKNPYKFRGIKRFFIFFFKFVPVFAWEFIKANMDIARRLLRPRLNLNPGIVRVDTTLKGEMALTFLANAITLSTGTLTVDVDSENGYLYVHWLYINTDKTEAATRQIVGKYEKMLEEIFE